MRRLVGRMLGGLVSLIFISTVALWVRSYWRCDRFEIDYWRGWELSANRGALDFSMLTERAVQQSQPLKALGVLAIRNGIATSPVCAVSKTLRFEHSTTFPMSNNRLAWFRTNTEDGFAGNVNIYNNPNMMAMAGIEKESNMF